MENREIDRQIAEKIMGWKLLTQNSKTYYGPPWPHNDSAWNEEKRAVVEWQPSTNITHAFEVVEKMRELLPNAYLSLMFPNIAYKRFRFRVGSQVWDADTSSMAICLAALKVMEK